MFGGYYLGQVYLGESGIYSQNLLVVNSTVHYITSDQLNLLQNSIIDVNNSTIENYADTVSIIQNFFVRPSVSLISISSDVVAIIEHKTLEINNAKHSLTTSDTLKIINWTELGIDYGRYIKDFSEKGSLDYTSIEDGKMIKKYSNIGSFESVQKDDSGRYDGKYKNKGIF